MHGIASLLNAQYRARVEEIWLELESFCGLVGVKQTPIPHFSWQIAEGYDYEQADEMISQIARHTAPFRARSSGLALFSGLAPVVYIPIVRDLQLSNLHQELWERMQPCARGLSAYYSPARWMPHITIAYGDVDPVKLGCATSDRFLGRAARHRVLRREQQWHPDPAAQHPAGERVGVVLAGGHPEVDVVYGHCLQTTADGHAIVVDWFRRTLL